MNDEKSQEVDLFRAVFDASPSALLLVDDDVTVLDANLAAADLLGQPEEPILFKRGGELIHCLHSDEAPGGCGRAQACKDCVVRATVGRAVAGQRVVRQSAAMELKSGDKVQLRTFLVSASPFRNQGRNLILLALEDISELLDLRAILPICANCKNIRDDQNYWMSVEKYFETHLGTDFSHAICPDCAKKLYPELLQDV